MEHSKYFEKIKYYYDSNSWSEYRVQEAVNKGYISQDEYNEIVNKN